jgi:diadenosine tetraphosphate (Ap4A) HIT family hydrolase
MHPCPFCNEIANPKYYRAAVNTAWKYDSRIMIDVGKAVVVPDHGPLVYPYALVIPKCHSISYAETEYSFQRAMNSCLYALSSHEAFGGSLCVFEHGSGGEGRGCQCISHCHLHVVRLDYPIESWLGKDFPEAKSSYLLNDVSALRGKNYLWAGRYFWRSNELQGYVVKNDECGTSQYFRRLIAAYTNQRDYDWRSGMNPEFIEKLYLEFQGSKT